MTLIKYFWRFRLLSTVAPLVVVLLLCGNMSWGQIGSGTLTGVVKDPSGAVVPGASLSLTEMQTGSHYASVANSKGIYTFASVPPGAYTLTVIYTGFQTYKQNDISVDVGSTTTANVTLKVGAATQVVTVTGGSAHLQTDTVEVGTVMSERMIQGLPLQFSGTARNPIQFVTLTPGFSGQMSNSPTVQGGYKLNGGQQAGASVILDGASINFVSANLQVNYGISPDAVQEFQVVTNTFDAEYGRMGGGIVNLVTKSGTNSLHGAFYDFLRNRDLDANSWINDHDNVPKPVDTQNDFGAEISGPVYIPWLYNGHNKTFFMFNYEGFRFNTGGNGLRSAPTQAMLHGDFSSLLQPSTIDGVTFPARILYNYTTCTGSNQGQPCQPFPDNKITLPEDPVSAKIAAVLPSSNSTQPYLNYVQKTTNPVSANLYDIRIDQNLGTKQKLFGSYDHDWVPNAVYTQGAPLDTSATNQETQYVRFGYDYIFGPSLMNHFNFGYSRRYRQEFSGEGSYGGNWPTKLGLGGVMNTTFPQLSFDYPDGINMPSNGADQFADNSYQYNDNVFWQHGRHNISFGVEALLQGFNINVGTATSGEFGFGTGPTSGPSPTDIDPNSGFGYASFYLGAASNGNIALPKLLGWRAKYYAAYVQDAWRATSKLTADIGFRYGLPLPLVEANNKMSFVDPTLPNPGAGGLPGAYVFEGKGPGRLGGRTPQSTFTHSFGPRIGLAYQILPGTVIRAGYGIYYQAVKVGGFGENDSEGFTGSYTYPTPASQQTPAVILSQIHSYPGPQPPFINPAVENGQQPTFILSRVARPGMTQTWTLDIQQQLPSRTILDVAYVGDHGVHLQAFLHDPNQGYPRNQARGACLDVNINDQAGNPACAGQAAVASPYPGFNGSVSQALRPFPQYESAIVDSATMSDPFGFYTYNGLQVKAQKRLSRGLTVLASYTWSKTITNADAEYPTESGWEGNGVSGALNTYNQKATKGLSEFDMPQSLVLSYVYDLPLGKGKAFANHGRVLNAVVGGWQIAGVQTYQSGTPLAVTSPNWDSGIFAGPQANLGASARPNIVPGVDPNGFHGGKFIFGQSVRLNPKAFVPAPNFTFGDAPRTLNVRTFANLDEDFDVQKHIPIFTDRINTVFRVDFFNAFNRHQFTGFNTTAGEPGFGQASSTTGGRSIQAELRLSY